MSQPFLTVILDEIGEEVTALISGTILDHAGVAIPAASLDSLALTLYNKRTGNVLNSRDQQDVLGVNGGTVTSGGVLSMKLSPADNALESQARPAETHVAFFEWTYNSGVDRGEALVEFVVRNLLKVT